MRIRKNVRLSSFMPAELIKPYECQMNQSPWDVIDFSVETETNFRQFERENNFTEGDGGLGNFNGDFSGSGATSLKEIAGKEKVVVHVEEMDTANEFGLKELGEKIIRCGKITNDDDDGELIIEIMAATKLIPTARRSRSSRATKGSTSNSNQNEFYYYSGFGPSWGKKRATQANSTLNVNIVNSDNVLVMDDGKDDQNNQKASDIGKVEDEHKVDDNDDETENGSKKRKKSVRARSLLSLM